MSSVFHLARRPAEPLRKSAHRGSAVLAPENVIGVVILECSHILKISLSVFNVRKDGGVI